MKGALLSIEKIATRIRYAVSCHIHLIRVLIYTITTTTIIIQLIILYNNIKYQTLNRPWPAFVSFALLVIHTRILSNMFPQAVRVPVLSGVHTAYYYIVPLYSD